MKFYTGKFYAGIGSRETPQDVLDLMEELALRLDFEGFTLRTGIAPGADQAFARGAGANAEWSLPWPSFEHDFVAEMEALDGCALRIVLPGVREQTIAEMHHPAWARLGQGARNLHARNVLQVLGGEGEQHSSFVVCWTKDGRASGGTGQAIRIAKAYGIEVRNLHDPRIREAAESFAKS